MQMQAGRPLPPLAAPAAVTAVGAIRQGPEPGAAVLGLQVPAPRSRRLAQAPATGGGLSSRLHQGHGHPGAVLRVVELEHVTLGQPVKHSRLSLRDQGRAAILQQRALAGAALVLALALNSEDKAQETHLAEALVWAGRRAAAGVGPDLNGAVVDEARAAGLLLAAAAGLAALLGLADPLAGCHVGGGVAQAL